MFFTVEQGECQCSWSNPWIPTERHSEDRGRVRSERERVAAVTGQPGRKRWRRTAQASRDQHAQEAVGAQRSLVGREES